MDEQELRNLEVDAAVITAARLVHTSLADASSALHLSPTGPSLKDIWGRLRSEVHELLCTNSPKYKEERSLFQKSYKPAIAALAAYLVSAYGLPIASATALAGLGVVLPVKMVVTSWCAAFEEKVSQAELTLIKSIGDAAAETARS
jgi:hypothetical protein